MTCKLCLAETERPAHFGSARRCAFGTEEFDGDNWQCLTMNALRGAGEPLSLRDDDQNASLCVVPIPQNGAEERGYIVLGYYKNRGCTGSAVIVNDDRAPRPLTLKSAELVVLLLNIS